MAAINPSDERVFIGIPCYNRPYGLLDTIRCLQQQTHTGWTALICDNASPDPLVRQIAEKTCQEDSRFRYFCQATNVGPAANFHHVAMQASEPLFMWASDDDLWHPDFISTNLQQLKMAPEAHMSFCTVDVINQSGEVLFACPGFSRFSSTGQLRHDVAAFLEDPEKQGKANLIYGLFRTHSVQTCIRECWDDAFQNFYGADFVFVFGFICRYAIVAHDAIHMHKRQPTNARFRLHWRHPRSYRVTPGREFESYVARCRKVAPAIDLANTAEAVLRRRQAERFLYLLPFADHFRSQKAA